MTTPRVTLFAVLLAIFEAVSFALFVSTVDYSPHTAGEDLSTGSDSVGTYYSFYSHVAIMVLIGFGYLMTFLRKYGFSAVGYTFLIAAAAFQWGVLCVAFAERLAEEMDNVDHEIWTEIAITVKFLIEGMFAAATVLISFGGTLGVTSPAQLLVMVIMEVPFYALNLAVGLMYWGAVDIGGSMFIHSFGAFFGIAASWVCTPKSVVKGQANSEEKSTRTSDLFAMIGTCFLWLLWPSFNSALAPGDTQYRVIINTVLSLTGSTIGAFLFSNIFHGGKFDMVHIQNATLAGGVAIGSAADLVVGPGFAILIGFVGSAISTLGYVYIGPFLQKRLGLHDTCGILFLHGLPGVLGAVAGAIGVADADESVYGVPFSELFPKNDTPSRQAAVQVGALGVTLALSIGGGLITGLVLRIMPREEHDSKMFRDGNHWEIPDEEIALISAKKPELADAKLTFRGGADLTSTNSEDYTYTYETSTEYEL